MCQTLNTHTHTERIKWTEEWEHKRGGASRWLRTGFGRKIDRALPVLSCVQLVPAFCTPPNYGLNQMSFLFRNIWATLMVRDLFFFFFFLHVFTSSHFHWPFSTYSLGLHTKPAEWGMCVQLGVPLSVLCETKSVKHHTQKKKKKNLETCWSG